VARGFEAVRSVSAAPKSGSSLGHIHGQTALVPIGLTGMASPPIR
jgi:hypothetical protein